MSLNKTQTQAETLTIAYIIKTKVTLYENIKFLNFLDTSDKNNSKFI